MRAVSTWRGWIPPPQRARKPLIDQNISSYLHAQSEAPCRWSLRTLYGWCKATLCGCGPRPLQHQLDRDYPRLGACCSFLFWSRGKYRTRSEGATANQRFPVFSSASPATLLISTPSSLLRTRPSTGTWYGSMDLSTRLSLQDKAIRHYCSQQCLSKDREEHSTCTCACHRWTSCEICKTLKRI